MWKKRLINSEPPPENSLVKSAGPVLEQILANTIQGSDAQRIGLACSGGMDSMVMVAATVNAWRHLLPVPKPKLFILHVNHELRSNEELQVEALKLLNLSVRFQVPLFVHNLKPGELFQKKSRYGGSLEALAREARYTALTELKQRLSLDMIFLAHHAQDQVEQRLIRFLQGISEDGGMPNRRGFFVRPLMDADHQTLFEYAQAHQLDWHEDSSNATNDFLRNQVRHRLIPVVAAIFPGYRHALQMRAERAAMDEDLLQSLSAQFEWSAQNGDQGSSTRIEVSLGAPVFFKQHPSIRLRVLKAGCLKLLQLGAIEQLPSFSFFQPLLGIAALRTETILREGQGIQVLLYQDQIVIRPYIVAPLKKGYLILLKQAGDLTIPGFAILSVIKADQGEKGFPLPMVVRSMSEGERLPQGETSFAVYFKKLGIRDELAEIMPLLEIFGQIKGVLSEPWLGYDIMFDKEAAVTVTTNDLYKLKIKELGLAREQF